MTEQRRGQGSIHFFIHTQYQIRKDFIRKFDLRYDGKVQNARKRADIAPQMNILNFWERSEHNHTNSKDIVESKLFSYRT